MAQPLVHLRNLEISFTSNTGGQFRAVRGIDISIGAGECLALVGESGCGKSLSAFSLLGIAAGNVSQDSYLFNGQVVDWKDQQFLRQLRGEQIGLVFQDALTAFDPVLSVGTQLMEAVRGVKRRAEKRALAVGMLQRVGIPDPESRMRSYPHQLSGGMRQRVMIAVALLNDPLLLIADEPTTSLDVTIQAQILDLFKNMRQEQGMSLLFITHDLGIVADIADMVSVMYAGRIVESGPVMDVLSQPAHPYTWGLLDSVPRISSRETRFKTISGRVPAPAEAEALQGCLFKPRCPLADARCDAVPQLLTCGSGRLCACFNPFKGAGNAAG